MEGPISASLFMSGIWGFPNIRGSTVGFPIITVFGGLHWDLPIQGNYHISEQLEGLTVRALFWTCAFFVRNTLSARTCLDDGTGEGKLQPWIPLWRYLHT